MSKPIFAHLEAAKRVLRYIKGTLHHGICFSPSALTLTASLMQIRQGTLLIDTPLLAYWSFLVLIPFHGLRRNKTLCLDHLQRLSTGHWLLLLLSFLGFEFCSRSSRFFFLIYLLSGVIMFLPNLVFHSKIKHLEVDYHFIPRQAYWDSCIELVSHVLGALH